MAERMRGDPRFNQNERYSIEDYLFRLEVVLCQMPEGNSGRQWVERMISEAKERPQGTYVRFKESKEDGTIYPVFETSIQLEISTPTSL